VLKVCTCIIIANENGRSRWEPVHTTGAQVCSIYFDFSQSAIAGERSNKIILLESLRALAGPVLVFKRICNYSIPLFGDLHDDGHVEAETCRDTSLSDKWLFMVNCEIVELCSM
jgi:hypothetical protein